MDRINAQRNLTGSTYRRRPCRICAVVDVYSSSVYRLGLKMLGNPEDAEDVLQNTFLNALIHLPDFKGAPALLPGCIASPPMKL